MIKFDRPGPWTDGVRQKFSATDGNTLRENATSLDAWSYRNIPAFVTMPRQGSYGALPVRVWRGTLRYRTGLTTLTWRCGLTKAGSERMQLYVNYTRPAGDDRSPILPTTGLADTVSTNGDFTRNVALSGYSDGQYIPLEIWATGSGGTVGAAYEVYDVYATPVSLTTYPGVPTFTASYPAAKLTQLWNAEAWLFNRVNLDPLPFRLEGQYLFGPNLPGEWILAHGGTCRYQANDLFQVSANCLNGGYFETLRIYINNVLKDTWTPPRNAYTASRRTVDLAGYSVGTLLIYRITATVTGVTPNVDGISRWGFGYIGAAPNASGHPVATPPAALPHYPTLLAAADLDAGLNALGALLTTTKAQIAAASDLWDKVRPFPLRPAKHAADDAAALRKWCYTKDRVGDRLLIKGKNVKLGFGAQTWDKTKDWDYAEYTWANEVSVIDGDKEQEVTVYLDRIAGLDAGVRYRLVGDVTWAGEYLT